MLSHASLQPSQPSKAEAAMPMSWMSDTQGFIVLGSRKGHLKAGGVTFGSRKRAQFSCPPGPPNGALIFLCPWLPQAGFKNCLNRYTGWAGHCTKAMSVWVRRDGNPSPLCRWRFVYRPWLGLPRGRSAVIIQCHHLKPFNHLFQDRNFPCVSLRLQVQLGWGRH